MFMSKTHDPEEKMSTLSSIRIHWLFYNKQYSKYTSQFDGQGHVQDQLARIGQGAKNKS